MPTISSRRRQKLLLDPLYPSLMGYQILCRHMCRNGQHTNEYEDINGNYYRGDVSFVPSDDEEMEYKPVDVDIIRCLHKSDVVFVFATKHELIEFMEEHHLLQFKTKRSSKQMKDLIDESRLADFSF